MSSQNVPEGWVSDTLGNLVNISIGKTPKRDNPQFWQNGIYKWATIANMEFGKDLIETSEKITELSVKAVRPKLVEKGTLLFSFKLTIGKMAFAGCDLFTNEAIAALTPKNGRIDKKFLFYALQIADLTANSGDAAKGSTLNTKTIPLIEVIFPADINEQHRIVSRIEELTRWAEEAITLKQKSSRDCSHILQSYIKKIVERCNSNSWGKVPLGDKKVAKVIMGQSPLGGTYNRNKDGLPLLNGPTEFGNYHPYPIQWTTDSKRQCKKGDILFCVRGSTTGRMNWADQIYSIGRGIASISANTQNVLPEFLYSMVEIQVSEILHNAEGGVFPNFNKDQLSKLIVPLPPMIQQQIIVEELVLLKKMIAELKAIQQDITQELETFQTALLAKAFRGEL